MYMHVVVKLKFSSLLCTGVGGCVCTRIAMFVSILLLVGPVSCVHISQDIFERLPFRDKG